MKKNFLYTSLIITVLFVSCMVTKPYQKPMTSTEGLYRDQTSSDTFSIATIHWKDFFGDTILQNLIGQAIEQNPDLKIATARIQEAEAYFQQSRLAFLPGLSANVSIQNGNTSTNKSTISSSSN